MVSATRNYNIANETGEFIYNDTKVYLFPLVSAGIALGLAAFFRLGMWTMINFTEYNNPWLVTIGATILILIVAGLLIKLGSDLYRLREFVNSELHLQKQANISGWVIASFFVFAMWENFGEWMFGPLTLVYFVVGALGISGSWAIRRWSDKRKARMPVEEVIKTSFWEEAGFGSTNEVACHAIAGGYLHKIKLDPKVTTKDLQDKSTLIAKNYNTNVKKIRIVEDPDDTNYAHITKFDNEPFANEKLWVGPHNPGVSIAEPIEIATYDIGNRQSIYLSGKNNASCHHWLTVGMSGSGKTYAWQNIYASVLNRREVSLVYIDSSKGVASGMPLASGIEWFAWDMDSAIDVISGIQRAIKARQSYLTQKGLPYWKPGCGINFIIFHVEEAADYISNKEANDKLTHIARAARSAGIALIYSLQRATNKELPVTLREQLEGRMTFKVGQKKENALALSGTSQEAGAQAQNIPVKGGFYMTSPYIDDFYAGNVLRVDAFDEDDLMRAVEIGKDNRTPLDNVTASAFGSAYINYRNEVSNGTTEWQRIRNNRTFDIKNDDTVEYQNIKTEYQTFDTGIKNEDIKSNRSQNLKSDPQAEKAKLLEYIKSIKSVNEEFTFTEIQKDYTEKFGVVKGTVWTRMRALVDEDSLGMNGKMYFLK